MKTEHLILALYGIPLIICIHAFYISSKHYEKLPDRIPTHFNIKGEADKWSEKGIFSVYLMPMICIFTLAGFIGILVFIHGETGYMPDIFNFALWLLLFSLIYIMYRTQAGMVQYALEETNNIWPFIKSGLILLIAACLLLVSSVMLYKKPFISKSIICAHIKNGRPIDNRTRFSKNDPIIYMWINLKNVMGKHHIQFQWINPEGNQHFAYDQYTHHKILAKYLPMWSYINIHNNRDKIIAGEWQVMVYVDNKKVLIKNFTLLE
jgi:hypothetical protein